jgi:hypothetical protein
VFIFFIFIGRFNIVFFRSFVFIFFLFKADEFSGCRDRRARRCG